ncbi:TrpR [Stenotrophomonas ginsengisoli]|uniref:TrpR n=1 Tax=Stenotrophomonas ginsengisoli TaxID=336566 RepID=A0A0R0CWW6_9GAMM|nr:YerC/YecD family TrpR-related protein [Stenotrophomonas ginsengisoli]KRG74281.1 TrpR [Stenotrophomonas ginsengisoli]
MKPRPVTTPQRPDPQALDSLAQAIGSLRSAEEVIAFLRDLCTPAELEAMSDRWRVVPLLRDGVPYRDIHQRTGVSVTTTGRVARTLEQGHGGYAVAIDRLAPR